MWIQLPVLLAPRLGEIPRIVLRAYNDCLLPGVRQEVGDIGREGSVTAFVTGNDTTVDPHRRSIVDSAKVEDHSLSGASGGHFEGSPVPANPVEARVSDAAR